VIFRDNLALYAAYASDFQTAEREARAIDTPDPYSVLALAFGQLGQGQFDQASESYRKLSMMGALGSSLAASGLADLAALQGRFREAARILEEGAKADIAANSVDRAAAKFGALANVHLAHGQPRAAIDAADKALQNSQSVTVRFLAGRALVEAGNVDKSHSLIESLANELQAEPQAYAKILQGQLALKSGEARKAVTSLSEANGLLDTWIGHFELGRAYLELKAYPQADAEFDRCLTRRGEALSLFLDEEPTSTYLAPVHYYLGRAREGLRSTRFAESYREYLNLRGGSSEDPIVKDVRGRAGR
jgi:tetratricopeptide (TPR) repeat protein